MQLLPKKFAMKLMILALSVGFVTPSMASDFLQYKSLAEQGDIRSQLITAITYKQGEVARRLGGACDTQHDRLRLTLPYYS